jgi:AraC-like DNA-binding protein
MIIYQFENIGRAYDYKNNTHSEWYVPPHIHEYSEFIFTKKGVFNMALDGKEYIVPENHLIFIGPNQLHECRSSAPSEAMCVVFSNDFSPYFHSKVKDKKFENPVFDFSNSRDIIYELDSTDSDKTLRLCGLLNLILNNLLEKGSLISKEVTFSYDNVLYLIINYISNNFTEDIHLSNIARDLGYNEKYLSSTIKLLTGMNFRTFLAMYRINYAINLMLNTQSSISEIAAKSGFSSINTFNRMFLKIMGMTPSDYKKEKS